MLRPDIINSLEKTFPVQLTEMSPTCKKTPVVKHSLVAQMVKHLPTKQETGLIPGLGKSPGEENGNPLQYPCLGNPIDRGAWWATDHGAAKSQTRLSD